ncbi:hypothetical protein GDO81_008026 [Engystomops pustulosus]|uniref:Secreted protein n=1 Tax=Engystomops pustulosus TaxID=76066 RepID=A0AAV7CD79_ENGPU|nr:hypothetical protein GDO81_008026 [Engystomops pustulosus]
MKTLDLKLAGDVLLFCCDLLISGCCNMTELFIWNIIHCSQGHRETLRCLHTYSPLCPLTMKNKSIPVQTCGQNINNQKT